MIPIEYDPYTLNIIAAQDGVPSVRLDNEDGTFLHLHSLVHPEQEADYYADLLLWGEVIVFAGTGLGYHLRAIIDRVESHVSIILVEYYPQLALKSELLVATDTVRNVLVVTQETKSISDAVRSFLPRGAIQVIRHPASWMAHKTFYQQVVGTIVNASQLKKKSRGVMFTEGTFFLEQELGNAAKMMDLHVSSLRYKNIDNAPDYEVQLQKSLTKGAPQCVVTVNMLGVDCNGMFSYYTSRYGIPSVHWFVDDPRPILLTRKDVVTPDMIACTWERAYIPFLEECGFGRVEYLPLAVDATKPIRVPRLTHTRGVGFIGSSMGRAFLSTIADKFLWKPEYERIAQLVAGSICAGNAGPIDALIHDTAGTSISDPFTLTWLRSYILHTASMMKRKRYIQALLPLGIELFGDESGWKELLGSEVVTHPDLDYQTEAASCYATTAVNINISSCQMPSALNQRIFDVPYSGGFLLTDYQEDLSALFAGDEYVAYSGEGDLVDKTEFYLHNDTSRNRYVEAACRRIVASHTYCHRLETILSWF